MKKITLAFTSFLLIQFTNAQVLKGSIFTGGSVGISNSNNDINTGGHSKNSNWQLSPQFGKAFQENKIIGIQLNANGNLYESDNGLGSSSKNSSTDFGIGLFYRQYFSIHPKWFLFGQATFSTSFGKAEGSSQGIKINNSKNWGAGIGITPGIAYKATKKIWLEASLNNLFGLNYSSQKINNLSTTGAVTSTVTQKNFNANASVNGFNSINLGIRWMIPKA